MAVLGGSASSRDALSHTHRPGDFRRPPNHRRLPHHPLKLCDREKAPCPADLTSQLTSCTGHEEVPEGCVAVLSGGASSPDVLSHSAVRARNMGVLLAACHNTQVSFWNMAVAMNP